MKSKYIWYWTKQPWPAIDLSVTEENDRSVCAKKFTEFIVNQTTHERGRERKAAHIAQSTRFVLYWLVISEY